LPATWAATDVLPHRPLVGGSIRDERVIMTRPRQSRISADGGNRPALPAWYG
jgi:hypothetical protein